MKKSTRTMQQIEPLLTIPQIAEFVEPGLKIDKILLLGRNVNTVSGQARRDTNLIVINVTGHVAVRLPLMCTAQARLSASRTLPGQAGNA